MTIDHIARTLIALLALLFSGIAYADYPERSVKIIVPISAGSTTDAIARLVAERLRTPLGQSVVVENVTGAGGSVGTAAVARAPADGYTLLVASSAHTVNPAIYKNLPYNTTADFSAVSVLATLPNILVTPPGRGLNSLEDLLTQGRAAPNKLTYGSGGVGSGAHMNAALFLAMAKVTALHVPFRGTPEVVNELIAGRIDFAFVPITTALAHIRAGKLVPLAVGASKRTPLLPDLRTTEEAGVAGSAHNEWIGMYVRSGVPEAILKRLNRDVTQVLRDASVAERLAALGATASPSSPEEADALVRSGIATSTNTVKLANIPTN